MGISLNLITTAVETVQARCVKNNISRSYPSELFTRRIRQLLWCRFSTDEDHTPRQERLAPTTDDLLVYLISLRCQGIEPC